MSFSRRMSLFLRSPSEPSGVRPSPLIKEYTYSLIPPTIQTSTRSSLKASLLGHLSFLWRARSHSPSFTVIGHLSDYTTCSDPPSPRIELSSFLPFPLLPLYLCQFSFHRSREGGIFIKRFRDRDSISVSARWIRRFFPATRDEMSRLRAEQKGRSTGLPIFLSRFPAVSSSRSYRLRRGWKAWRCPPLLKMDGTGVRNGGGSEARKRGRIESTPGALQQKIWYSSFGRYKGALLSSLQMETPDN